MLIAAALTLSFKGLALFLMASNLSPAPLDVADQYKLLAVMAGLSILLHLVAMTGDRKA